MVSRHTFHDDFATCLKHYGYKALPAVLDDELFRKANNFIANGAYYGYPPCCVKDWVFRVIITGHQIKVSDEQYRASECSGFLPCPAHAKQVLEKKVRLGDLICVTTRKCPHEFV